jgi:Sulfotransferase family
LNSKKIDFFIVGAARSGTTTLWNWLKVHPSIFLPDSKEPHFFCFDGIEIPCHGNELDPHYKKHLMTSNKDYQLLYADSKLEQLNGDASPGYLYYSGTASRLKTHNPNAKIICILRNPCDRAFSQYIFHAQSGFESVFKFQTALELENVRISQGWWWGYHYLRAGNYASQWKEYCEAFGDSQRLLLLYEDLKFNPKLTYSRICDFLQIPYSEADLELHSNGTSDLMSVPLNSKLHRLITHGISTKIRLHDWLPDFIIRPVKNFIIEFNKRPKPELSDSFRNQIKEHYRIEVDELRLLTGMKFSQWDYDD